LFATGNVMGPNPTAPSMEDVRKLLVSETAEGRKAPVRWLADALGTSAMTIFARFREDEMNKRDGYKTLRELHRENQEKTSYFRTPPKEPGLTPDQISHRITVLRKELLGKARSGKNVKFSTLTIAKSFGFKKDSAVRRHLTQDLIGRIRRVRRELEREVRKHHPQFKMRGPRGIVPTPEELGTYLLNRHRRFELEEAAGHFIVTARTIYRVIAKSKQLKDMVARNNEIYPSEKPIPGRPRLLDKIGICDELIRLLHKRIRKRDYGHISQGEIAHNLGAKSSAPVSRSFKEDPGLKSMLLYANISLRINKKGEQRFQLRQAAKHAMRN